MNNTTGAELHFPEICDCHSCQLPGANASVAFDPENPLQGSLILNFPLDSLRQTVNLNGERRVVVEFDIQSGSLEYLVNLVGDAAAHITGELMSRGTSTN